MKSTPATCVLIACIDPHKKLNINGNSGVAYYSFTTNPAKRVFPKMNSLESVIGSLHFEQTLKGSLNLSQKMRTFCAVAMIVLLNMSWTMIMRKIEMMMTSRVIHLVPNLLNASLKSYYVH